jgi:autoinducer 2-degrading protein
MYVVLATAYPYPDRDAQFVAEMTRNAADSVAHESGCYRFDYMRRSDLPLCYVLIELYADRQAFEKHLETAHFLRWRDVSHDVLTKPLEVQTGEMVYPVSLS